MEYPCKGLDIIVIRPVFVIYVQNSFLNIDSPGYENRIICQTVVKRNDTLPVLKNPLFLFLSLPCDLSR